MALSLLGAYAAQSQLGDFDVDIHGTTSDYLRTLELAPGGHTQLHTDELLDNIAELHRTHR